MGTRATGQLHGYDANQDQQIDQNLYFEVNPTAPEGRVFQATGKNKATDLPVSIRQEPDYLSSMGAIYTLSVELDASLTINNIEWPADGTLDTVTLQWGPGMPDGRMIEDVTFTEGSPIFTALVQQVPRLRHLYENGQSLQGEGVYLAEGFKLDLDGDGQDEYMYFESLGEAPTISLRRDRHTNE